ncbi:MAG: aldehyde dehydrogenase family protein [Chitinophagaceae bacterium]|nr:aldehyde dehydrogenase family protein [Chitinophagaceae bacterium]
MARLSIQKTYKIFIGGQFPRTESGRFYPVYNSGKELLANMCLSSRKDFRNAVVAARKAFGGWSSKSAFNRGQILYRIAEMMEGRKHQFIAEIMSQGSTQKQAEQEVQTAIDRCVYYCGWCDKYQQLFSAVNPVASAHFNFSVPEPTGVVSIIAPENTSLLGLVSVILPVIAGGNVCVVLASESKPLCSITLAEVLATSDLPGGVVNVLTGQLKELHTHMASHMDVNAVVYARENRTEIKAMAELCSLNVKRFFHWNHDWKLSSSENPYLILDLQEIKTTWHPIEKIGASGSGY